MHHAIIRRSLVSVLLIAAVLKANDIPAVPILFTAGGPNDASIQSSVDAFRVALGEPNNGNALGPLDDGRREINWDGGGVAITPSGTPFAGFLNIRGALFSTPGTGFIQAPIGGFASQFNPTYAATFSFFSPQRLFSPIDSTITDVLFFIPGTNGAVPATVDGFGAVFTDVDLANSSGLQFFDVQGNSLGTFFAPALTGDRTLSFLGVVFTGEQIARVRVTSGNTALGPNDNLPLVDIVALDDFLYSEPQATPEPTALLLIGVGLIILRSVLRRFLLGERITKLSRLTDT